MKKTITFLLFTLLIIPGIRAQAITGSILNLNFQEVNEEFNTPDKWHYYSDDDFYKTHIEKEENYNFLTLTNTKLKQDSNSIGSFIGIFPLEKVKGKTMTLKGEIKNEGITEGSGALFITVLGQKNEVLTHVFTEDLALGDTTSWKEVSIVSDIDKEARVVSFGGALTHDGSASFRNLEILIDGEKFQDIDSNAITLSKKQLKWLKKYVYPLKTSNPFELQDDDLKVLNKLIDTTQVVALGEVTHGIREIFQMKHRLLRYFAENMDFDIFSIEANLPESYRINDYVLSATGDPVELLKGTHFWVWHTEEVLDMINWIKDYNEKGNHVQFTGFDMQFVSGPTDELKKAFDEDIEALILIERIQPFGSGNRKSKTAYMNELLQIIEKSQYRDSEKEWLKRCVRILEQRFDNISARDQYMAENLLWIRSQNPGSKIVAWAHNEHIKLNENMMGEFLKDELVDNYATIGFAVYDGTYTGSYSNSVISRTNGNDLGAITLKKPVLGTYEYYFNLLEEPIFLLDIKSMRNDDSPYGEWFNKKLLFRGVGGGFTKKQFYRTNLINKFDYLIFIKDVTHSKLLPPYAEGFSERALREKESE